MIRTSWFQDTTLKTYANVSRLMIAALLVSSFVGCEARDSTDKVRSVEWYETYEAERAQKLAECKANQVIQDATPDCVNASLAENSAKNATSWQDENDEDKIRTSPPINK